MLRIVFMGTGDIALPTFSALIGSSHEVVALYTQPDKPVGRKQILTPPKLKVEAERASVPVLQPEYVGCDRSIAQINDFRPDVIVVMAYGQILPQALIDTPKLAIINLHASLLPKYRGASCIQAAIAAGDSETGMTVMHVVKKLDAGDIICRSILPLNSTSTGGEVHDQLADLGPASLMEALELIESGKVQREIQDHNTSSYAPKLMREHGLLDWSQSAKVLERYIRAYDPWPGTFTTFIDTKGKERRLKIFPQVEAEPDDNGAVDGQVLDITNGLLVACGDGALRVKWLQADGSKKTEAKMFLSTGKLAVGAILGSTT